MSDIQSTERSLKPSLTLIDGLQLALKAGDKIDTIWYQYFTVVFALLAWLSSNITRIGPTEAGFITIGIVLFSIFNCNALIRAYLLIDLIVDETNALAKQSIFIHPRVQSLASKERQKFTFPFRIPVALFAHIIAAAAIIYLAWNAAPRSILHSSIH